MVPRLKSRNMCYYSLAITAHEGKKKYKTTVTHEQYMVRLSVCLFFFFKTENFLKHKIRSRPDRSELVRMHILEGKSFISACYSFSRKKVRLPPFLLFTPILTTVSPQADVLQTEQQQEGPKLNTLR